MSLVVVTTRVAGLLLNSEQVIGGRDGRWFNRLSDYTERVVFAIDKHPLNVCAFRRFIGNDFVGFRSQF